MVAPWCCAEGTWAWVDDSPWTYANWQVSPGGGQPIYSV
jgi:hypothetical protein